MGMLGLSPKFPSLPDSLRDVTSVSPTQYPEQMLGSLLCSLLSRLLPSPPFPGQQGRAGEFCNLVPAMGHMGHGHWGLEANI